MPVLTIEERYARLKAQRDRALERKATATAEHRRAKRRARDRRERARVRAQLASGAAVVG